MVTNRLAVGLVLVERTNLTNNKKRIEATMYLNHVAIELEGNKISLIDLIKRVIMREERHTPTNDQIRHVLEPVIKKIYAGDFD